MQVHDKEDFEKGYIFFRGGLKTTPVSLAAYDLGKTFTLGIIIGPTTRICQRRGRYRAENGPTHQKTKANAGIWWLIWKNATPPFNLGVVYSDHFKQERHFWIWGIDFKGAYFPLSSTQPNLANSRLEPVKDGRKVTTNTSPLLAFASNRSNDLRVREDE